MANELRACKESQARTWGDIDDSTLGRYLAGEMTLEEMADLESSLDTLPELRKLTSLVRDVLGDPKPMPRIVPVAKRAAPRRSFPHVLGERGALVAAACVIIFLGVVFPRPPILSAPQEESSHLLREDVAMRGLFAAVPQAEPRVGVRDEAQCFSARTLRATRQQLGKIALVSGVEVLVETCCTSQSPSAVVDRLGPKAVHIVIDATKAKVAVHLGDQLQQQGLSAEKLQEQLAASCRTRQFDRALLESLRTIRGQVQPSAKK